MKQLLESLPTFPVMRLERGTRVVILGKLAEPLYPQDSLGSNGTVLIFNPAAVPEFRLRLVEASAIPELNGEGQ